MSPRRRIPPALWPRVSALFDQAQALPESERAAWLQALAATEPEAAPHVRALLAASATDDELTPPAGELLAAALGAQVQHWEAGSSIGIYRLLAPLGQGGMASVWAAGQTQGVHRRVAPKLPHAGLEAPAALARRFEQERDLLAQLEHAHIARLYDAGISPQGQPFLAMELVEGRPITEFAAALPLRQRLAIFAQVLDAVSFAHARLVVHRDLKPGNILVTAAGQAKLLDFGIARLLGQADAAPGGLAGRAFTPDCASPEQLAGLPLGVASDVYSLGVVLYELLTGQRPYQLNRHGTTPLAQQLALARVRPPSQAAPQQRRALAGDLDAIVARALALDPAQRYPSAEALAADLQRHLSLQPVLARGGGRRYMLGRLLRRQRVPVAASLAVLLALVAGLGTALWQARQAQAQAQRALAAQRFLVQVFNASHPEQAQGREVSAKALLDRGAGRLATELQGQPELRAELHSEIGGIYIALGDNVAAQRQLALALQLYGQLGLRGSEAAIQTQYLQFEALKEDQQFEAARDAAARVLEHAGRAFGNWHRWLLPVRDSLAFMANQQGDAAAAETLLQQALDQATPQDDPIQRLRTRATLGTVQLDRGRFTQARATFAQVIAASATLPGYETTDRLIDRYSLACARYNLGEFNTVAAELGPLVAEMDRHIGPQHDRTLKARSLWAQAAAEAGNPIRALAVQRENLAHALARGGDDEVPALQRLTLAKLLKGAGRYSEGVPLARQGLAVLLARSPQATWLGARARWVLGELLLGSGATAEGRAVLAQAVASAEALADHANNPWYADLLQSRALAERGPAADAALRRAEAIYTAGVGPDSAPVRRARCHRLWLAALAQPADAATFTAFEREAEAWAGGSPLAAAGVALMRAEVLARAGHPAQARAERERGAAAWVQALGVPFNGPFLGLH